MSPMLLPEELQRRQGERNKCDRASRRSPGTAETSGGQQQPGNAGWRSPRAREGEIHAFT